MLKRIFSLTIALALILNFQPIASYGSTNLSYEEIEAIIEEVAEEKDIPGVILKAIAWKESNYQQFDGNGNPYVSYGNTGIMQINKVHTHLDQNKLRDDIKYNIEAGANILLSNWNSRPTIGDGNKDVLENWYFALWGYNGWLGRNNPNVSGSDTYQEEIFELIRNRYDQPITSISGSLLPNSGLPSSSLTIDTPEVHHNISTVFQDIIDHPKRQYIEKLYQEEIVNGVGDNKFAPDELITKEEALLILDRAVADNEKVDVDLTPEEPTTRGEFSEWIVKALDI